MREEEEEEEGHLRPAAFAQLCAPHPMHTPRGAQRPACHQEAWEPRAVMAVPAGHAAQ